MEDKRHYPTDILIMVIGTAIYAFGLVYLNIANHLAEGGLTGITLILRAVFHINPAYSSLILNIPLILLGGKILGKRSFWYTVTGTVSLSIFLWIWQKIPLELNVEHDMLIASLLAGLAAGVGSGLVYRVGGTTGGADIVARIVEKHIGMGMGRSLFIFDIFVLTSSLIYIDIQHMMYTLIASFVFSRVVEGITSGGYTVRGMLIISQESEKIAEEVMKLLDRGVTFLDGEGAFSGEEKKIIYIVLSPREIMEVKRMILEEFDDRAFISVINVHEAIGEGFTYERRKKSLLNLKKS
ncbi:Uncharacterized membrane-anchored protein YitT, contains DUF161 and DUF2179 domains [Pilibacter termitis]|uniref:Uncharacterized membrane-anchored protein YitT, contains DUF161 and DUF2179 domains n=1 Tax=Pilibacter termitis TaxID=263852 RepID=A0A1T4N1T9_9ENTE|nr:YitT family protein [Pilibacter termitis]SJZ73074.1 Uncharacterized membrane-anchored protein YitT, contains DUF161 and DUF2179 domains [Pilibacter termitis]